MLTAGCGTDDGPAPAPSTTAVVTTTPTPGPSGTATAAPSGTATVAVGRIPTGFPSAKVPLVPGVVTAGSGGAVSGEPGRQGWILELAAAGTRDSCFAAAEEALVKAGFVKRGSMLAGDTQQAQYTAPGYAVIISARSDGDGRCQLGYEVGEVAR